MTIWLLLSKHGDSTLVQNLQSPFFEKHIEAYDHGNCFWHIYLHYFRATYFTTVLDSASVLEAFKILFCTATKMQHSP